MFVQLTFFSVSSFPIIINRKCYDPISQYSYMSQLLIQACFQLYEIVGEELAYEPYFLLAINIGNVLLKFQRILKYFLWDLR